MRFSFRTRRTFGPAGALMAAATLVGACTTDTLDVVTPDVIAVGDVNNLLGVNAQRAGTIQYFNRAFSGNTDNFVVLTGTMADEIITTDTFFDRLLPNERNATASGLPVLDGFYLALHRARANATRTILNWSAVKPASKDTLGELYALRGTTENFFAEMYCSGVPFSEEVNGEQVFGQPETTAQILARSVASFDTALSNATSAQFRQFAQVGKGRALLNAGQFAAAAAAVAGVPNTFAYRTFHSISTSAQYNGIVQATSQSGSRYNVTGGSVAPFTPEGTNGYMYLQTPADPRMPWQASSRTGFDGSTRNMPTQLKYPIASGAVASTTPVVVADGIEARLIEAEAAFQASNGSQAGRDALLAALNTLRTGVTGLAPIAAAPTTPAGAVDLLFRERAAWMWLTGHRLGDMRRLIRQYGRDANTVFPIGPVLTRSGSVYGNDVNYPIPFDETNNPNFKGCLNRAA